MPERVVLRPRTAARFILFAGALLAAALIPRAASAEEEPRMLACVEEADWPPFTPALGNPSGGRVAEGLSYELAMELGRRLGLPTTFETCTMARALSLIEHGSRDLIVAISESEERSRIMVFSSGWTEKVGSVYARTGALQPEAFADLAGRRVGVVRGNAYGAAFEEEAAARAMVLDVSPDSATLFRKLAAGRIDAALSADSVAAELVKALGLSRTVRRTDLVYQRTTYRLGVSRKSPLASRMADVEASLAAMRADGTLGRLLGRYGLIPAPPPAVP